LTARLVKAARLDRLTSAVMAAKAGRITQSRPGRSETTISAYMALLGSLSLNLRFAVPSRRSAIALLPSPDPNQPNKNPHAVELGRLGGKKGGRVRAERLI